MSKHFSVYSLLLTKIKTFIMKTQLCKLGLLLMSSLLSMNAIAQADPELTMVDTATNNVTVTNLGNASIDVSNYWVCLGPNQYGQLTNLGIVTGDYMLNAGEAVTFTFPTIAAENADGAGGLGLFSTNSFGSTDSDVYVDYMQWGAADQDRSAQAVTAEIWDSADDFISCPSPYVSTTSGSNAIAWGEAAAGTIAIDADATTTSNGTTAVDTGTNTAIICIDALGAPVHVTKMDYQLEASYRYVITDDENKILNIADTDELDLTIAGVGTCRIWGWSYRGTPDNGAGFIDGPLADLEAVNCSDITDNWVTVVRVAPEAGTIAIDADATTTSNGTTAVDTDTNTAIICIDALGSPVHVIKSGEETNLSYRYVITDDQNKILNIADTDELDLTIAGVGTCRIWGWSYRGTPDNGAGFIDGPLADLEAENCSDITDNWVTVVRVAPEAGTVSIDVDNTSDANGTTLINAAGNTATILVKDSQPNPIIIAQTGGEPNLSYRYVITDDADTILNIVGTNEIDLNDVAAGTCRVWGWSYRGTPNNGLDFVGSPIADLDAVNCSDISSNWVTIIRTEDETTLSVNDAILENIEIQLFPNPTADTLRLSGDELANGYSVSVYSMGGQLIMQAEYSQATNAIDVTGLSNGVYLVEISDENSGSSIVKQFVKN